VSALSYLQAVISIFLTVRSLYLLGHVADSPKEHERTEKIFSIHKSPHNKLVLKIKIVVASIANNIL